MSVRLVIAVLFVAAGPLAASAQDVQSYQQRQRDLVALAGLFGELHHLRRTCDPQFEADIWRDRMKKLIDLEEPQPSEREALVQAFNKSYRRAQRRHPSCDRRARDYAASRAMDGEPIVARLSEPLLHEEEVEEGFTTSPYLITPTTD